MLRSAFVGLVCCSVVAPVVRAQPPNPERAARIEETRRQLRSDAQTVAWGAFNTGTYRLIELAPELAQVLEAPVVTDAARRYVVIQALLDAVVQSQAAIPASILREYWVEWPVQTAIALARATGDRDAVPLELLSSATGDRRADQSIPLPERPTVR